MVAHEPAPDVPPIFVGAVVGEVADGVAGAGFLGGGGGVGVAGEELVDAAEGIGGVELEAVVAAVAAVAEPVAEMVGGRGCRPSSHCSCTVVPAMVPARGVEPSQGTGTQLPGSQSPSWWHGSKAPRAARLGTARGQSSLIYHLESNSSRVFETPARCSGPV